MGTENRSCSKWWAVWILSLALCFVVTGVNGHDGHGHSHHGHSHGPDERPSFKYSKEANQPADDHSHASSHGHSHSHSPAAHGHQHSHNADRQPEDQKKSSKRTSGPVSNNSVWMNALLSTVLISMAPFLILFIIPVDNKIEHKPLLKVLLSFASGGLLGDAFLHLIPHAVTAVAGDEHSHSHSHSHSHDEPHEHDLSVGLSVLAGFVAFLMVEKFILIVKGSHGHQHSHQHDIHEPAPKSPSIQKEKKEDNDVQAAAGDTPRTHHRSDDDNLQAAAGDTPRKQANEENEPEKTPSPVIKNPTDSVNEFSSIKTSGYLNLAADFFHNFTDGLAIGASFLAGQTIGIITTMTVLLHEVPHEIGDFAILIQSGCSRRKAMMLQLVTAIGALSGCLVSLAADGLGDMTAIWTLPFTAGGFIYIATVSVIPELLEETNAFQSIKELLAMFVGIYMMVLIAKYE